MGSWTDHKTLHVMLCSTSHVSLEHQLTANHLVLMHKSRKILELLFFSANISIYKIMTRLFNSKIQHKNKFFLYTYTWDINKTIKSEQDAVDWGRKVKVWSRLWNISLINHEDLDTPFKFITNCMVQMFA